MNEQKKKVIIGEIEYWRQSHLLPGQYCDFLLNLYTEGESAGTGNGAGKEQAATASEPVPAFSMPKMDVKWVSIGLGASVLLYLAFHFTDFTFTMQMILIGILTMLFYILSFIRKRTRVSSHLFLGMASVLLAIGGIHYLNSQHYDVPYVIAYLAACCLVWHISGMAARKYYLSFCAILGLQGIYGWNTYVEMAGQFEWWRLESFWLPVSIVLIATGLIWKRRREQTAAVLFFTGLVSLFGAEVESLFINGAGADVLLYYLYVKIFLTGFLLLSLKNFWWPWISRQHSLR
ncbi:hypothetical protein [Aneurinibacillus tyrosinisolvens]|uniref:hypothetical protein n=1 Tax=Aneurinibacillus tyrosinisolvens TaxID=1443435 RepID=UPI00063F440B|nr:hypothetical protein [Aneurinibacillus tyrosinisolvens]